MGSVLKTNNSNLRDAIEIYYGFLLKSRSSLSHPSSLNDAEKVMYSTVIIDITRELTPVELVQLHAELVARKIVFKEIFEGDSLFELLQEEILKRLDFRIAELSNEEKNDVITEINKIIDFERKEVETRKQWISERSKLIGTNNDTFKTVCRRSDTGIPKFEKTSMFACNIEFWQNEINILQNHKIIYEEHLAKFNSILKR